MLRTIARRAAQTAFSADTGYKALVNILSSVLPSTAAARGQLCGEGVLVQPAAYILSSRFLAGAADTQGPKPTQTPKDLYMAFTCGRCDTRSVKGFTRHAYEKGLVIVTCPQCQAKHLIADNLGWFGDNGNVEDWVREKGGDAVRIRADGTVEVDPEDLVGLMAGKSRAPL